MSILSGPEILRIINRTRKDRMDWVPLMLPAIDIAPLIESHFGPNSVDVRLSDKLLVYNRCHDIVDDPDEEVRWYLDAKEPNQTHELTIPPEGLVLSPGTLYLGSTIEKTMCAGVVPWLDGRSSVGRLGIQIHMTAGRGDDNFGFPDPCTWTMEITVVHPVRVYSGMRIGQLTFFEMRGERKPYAGRYQHQSGPVASRIHEGEK